MSSQQLKAAATGHSMQQQRAQAAGQLQGFLEKYKAQFNAALPKHLNVDRMIRLALTAFSANKKLQECDMQSIAASIVVASQLGLEIGVAGQAFLVPYGGKCQCIPGWRGFVDLVSRSGRATVWTGAVFDGDEFDYALGDSPFIRHRPSGEDSPAKLLYVYAVGRVNGSQWPVIEVWPIARVWKHRDKNNKVGRAHYSFENPEMYARKVPLLQVIKYMPKSIELSNALTAEHANEQGRTFEMVVDTILVDTKDGQRAVDNQPHKEAPPLEGNGLGAITAQEVHDAIANAADGDAMDAAADLIREVLQDEQEALRALYEKRRKELTE